MFIMALMTNYLTNEAQIFGLKIQQNSIVLNIQKMFTVIEGGELLGSCVGSTDGRSAVA